MNPTNQLIAALKENGQDFEWYPTTDEMISAVRRWIPEDANSIMDIGAGDGRVLAKFAEKCKDALLYSIEIAPILHQKQPKEIIPAGTDLHEQNLSSLPVSYIFSNPPYSEYQEWVRKIVEEGYAKKAFLVIPQRWVDSEAIKIALKKRGATTRVIHSGDFHDAPRQARAVVDIVEISYPADKYGQGVKDPFEIWFDQNIDTFTKAEEIQEPKSSQELARKFSHASIDEIVAAYQDEYKRLEKNYRAIFQLDITILHELGINKEAVCGGLKMKMLGLKTKYWQILFDRLDAITSRLTTKSKNKLLEKLTQSTMGLEEDRDRYKKYYRGTSVEFTVSNAYSVVLWAIKNANQYFDEQLIELFKTLSQFENVRNYKSNEKTCIKDGWRYGNSEWKNTHYSLDYRIVVAQFHAIVKEESWYKFDYPGNLHKDGHELIADTIAVLNNLGFSSYSLSPLNRTWQSGKWQDWYDDSNKNEILFQAKAFMNGNMHFRFKPEAIMALNIHAARLLKWVRTEEEVVTEMGYTPEVARKYFRQNHYLMPSNVPLLGGGEPVAIEEERQSEQLPEFSTATQNTLF